MKRRTYRQYCGVAYALDLAGERWTLLLVRDLLLGPQRYTDLLRGLPGLTPNLLSKRLQELEARGLVERLGGASADARAYRLTPLGEGLEPVVQALARWGLRHMAMPGKGEARRFDWLLIGLRATYRGGAALRAEFVVDGARYRVVLSETGADIARGDVRSPDVRIVGSAGSITRWLMAGGKPVEGATIDGDVAAARRLLAAFATETLSLPSLSRSRTGVPESA